ncbi:hypothetical protein GQ43DRAFT_944 [Delitschia confertaspora ATCC 74209]|uniref:Fumarylacetoacetase-like C-terminal domain-containing protein n=1 Tax=Delitschia confertaspora ATCC 74209 TaxID=1513339 RepID=A0A9P4JVG2_9PLEO|nr:hypothetical protein GQ43DRAFT_944 [Delitschia confertaspora ATCC 74209]
MKPSFALRESTRTWTSGENYHYGEPILPPSTTFIEKAKQARIIKGNPFNPKEHSVTREIAPIDTLLTPILKSNINAVRCLGLNYYPHARESKLPIPKYPVLFYKPRYSLADPRSPLLVPRFAQSPAHIDYECELVAIIGSRIRNATPPQALDAVIGYAVGNDVSHRTWQLERGGGQWNFGKGFDRMTPFGPGIVRPEVLGAVGKDPGRERGEGKGARIWTKVNGEMVQEGWTGDMIFGVGEAVSFLSQGTTLFPGDLVFMGTPSGVGMARNPPLWLKHGDLVEVGLEGVGTCSNYIHFEGKGKGESEE